MTTTAPAPLWSEVLKSSTPPAPLLAELRDIHVNPEDWSATVGPRRLTADSSQELRNQLIGAMYEVLHTGRREEKDLGRIVRERDVEEQLLAALPHATSPRTARLIERREADGVVDFGDLRVSVPAEFLPQDVAEGQVSTLQLPAARPALSHGFLMIDGPLGMRRSQSQQLRRLYVHATDFENAAHAWRVVLETLNADRAYYRSKTLSHRDGYPRRDAIVVYLPANGSTVTEAIAAAVGDLNGIAPDTSLFAHRIGPGVAIADEPSDPRPQYRELSFGEHRSAVAANALIRAAQEPDRSLEDLFVEECHDACINPALPAFNIVSDHN